MTVTATGHLSREATRGDTWRGPHPGVRATATTATASNRPSSRTSRRGPLERIVPPFEQVDVETAIGLDALGRDGPPRRLRRDVRGARRQVARGRTEEVSLFFIFVCVGNESDIVFCSQEHGRERVRRDDDVRGVIASSPNPKRASSRSPFKTGRPGHHRTESAPPLAGVSTGYGGGPDGDRVINSTTCAANSCASRSIGRLRRVCARVRAR